MGNDSSATDQTSHGPEDTAGDWLASLEHLTEDQCTAPTINAMVIAALRCSKVRIYHINRGDAGERELEIKLTNGETVRASELGDWPLFSMNAAISHVPAGWAWKVGTCSVSDDAWVVPDFNCPVHGERLRKQFFPISHGSIWDTGIDIEQRPAGRPALALCRAILIGLIAAPAEEKPDETR